ncbi:hypothetical protein [Ramlibacter sp.]|uniref:hypothetical protein n=1 Tax=Ramlibacter sp. TaxID=1917967 RepID=UPI003D0E2497
MSVANLHELHVGLCELAGCEPPPLQGEPHGPQGFALHWKGVPLGFSESDARPGIVFATATLGTMPPECEAEGWRILMAANFGLAGHEGGGYSRVPGSGEVLMHAMFALHETTVPDVFRFACSMAEKALEWRDDCLFGDTAGAASPPAPAVVRPPADFARA